MALPVEGFLGFEPHAGCMGFDEEYGDSATVEPGRDEHPLCLLGDRDSDLRAVQAETAGGLGGRGDRVARIGTDLAEGSGQQGLALRHPGEEPALLLVAAESGEGQGPVDHRREERHVRDRFSDLFEHEADLDEAGARAALLFRDRDADQPGLGELRPGVAVDALAGFFEGFAGFERRLIGENLPGEIRDRVLFVGEREVHGRSPRTAVPRACEARTSR